MGQAIGQMLTMAVGVALSPIPIIAVVLLLAGQNGKVKGISFVVGSVASTAIVGGALVAIGVGSGADSDGGPSSGTSTLKVVLGLLLIGLAAKQWRGRPIEGEGATMPKWMGALDSFTPLKAFGAGVVLNVVNPKNLLLIVAGATAVAGAGATDAEEALAWLVFTVIAAIGVSTPVVIALSMGERADGLLERLKTWMAHNNGVIVAVILLLIGVKLLGDGLGGF